MELLHKAIAVVVVDNETQVQIVGRLAEHVHPLFLEHGQRRSDLVQDCTDTPAHQADCRAVRQHLNPPMTTELDDQVVQRSPLELTTDRVNRHGDVALGRRHQVHRDSVVGENREQFRQVPGGLPHCDAFNGNQGNPALQRHRFHHRFVIRQNRGQRGPGDLRMRCATQEHRNFGVANRRDGPRMDHRSAGRGYLLRFLVVQHLEHARTVHKARVGTENPRHIGPDLQSPGTQPCRQARRTGVRTAATEQHGLVVLVGRDKPLGQDHCTRRGKLRLQLRIGGAGAQGTQIPLALGLVRCGHRAEQFPGVAPLDRQALGGQPCGG